MRHRKGAPPTALSRPTRAAGRLITCQLGGDTESHSINRLRAQLLSERHGVPRSLAIVLAPLAFGGQHG
jgi:hypothetical protein